MFQCDKNGSVLERSYGSPVVIKRLLTPRKLQSVASLQHLTSASDTELHFTASANDVRFLRFTLDSLGTIPPGALNNLTINIQVHFHQSPRADTDPQVALCDSTTCNGIVITDSGNYPNLPCCYKTFAPGPTTDRSCPSNCGKIVATNAVHPKTVSLTFVPSERWGSFGIPEGNGFTTSHIFGTQLDPTQGLSVEMYGHDSGEQYKLGYIIVEVIREE